MHKNKIRERSRIIIIFLYIPFTNHELSAIKYASYHMSIFQAHSDFIQVLEGDKIKCCGMPWKLSRLMPLFVTDTDKGGFAGLT